MSGRALADLVTMLIYGVVFFTPLLLLFCWAVDRFVLKTSSKGVRIFLPIGIGFILLALLSVGGAVVAAFISLLIRTITYKPHDFGEENG